MRICFPPLTDGTLIVVRIGSTTYDNVIRAMQTLVRKQRSRNRGQWRARRRTLQQVHVLLFEAGRSHAGTGEDESAVEW